MVVVAKDLDLTKPERKLGYNFKRNIVQSSKKLKKVLNFKLKKKVYTWSLKKW